MYLKCSKDITYQILQYLVTLAANWVKILELVINYIDNTQAQMLITNYRDKYLLKKYGQKYWKKM